MPEQITELLRKSQLSVTDSRKKILELFLQSDSALAHHDIEVRTKEKFDRVTVYRTLQTFMDKGIIHTIPTTDNSIKYALCKDSCEQGHHHDDHVHFICSLCGTTTCLEEIHIPEIKLPRGYKTTQTEVIVSGICKLCS
ncbi:MAG: transcriptional repressor [Chitinophagaceae bacterium]|nr:transcriptional repressor [Chitinophagaceae bacterium]